MDELAINACNGWRAIGYSEENTMQVCIKCERFAKMEQRKEEEKGKM